MKLGERIQNEPLDVGDRVELADDIEPGLFARVRHGKKGRTVNFIYRRNHNGKRYYEAYGSVSLKGARAQAHLKNAEVITGQANPTEKSNNVPTVREAWEDYREFRLAKKNLKDSTRKFYEFASKHFLDAYDFVRINKLTRGDCGKLHTKLGRTAGHRTANAAIDLLGRVWDWAAVDGHCGDRRNPASKRSVQRYTIQERSFDKDDAEVKRFFTAAQKDPLRDLWILLAFTGVRISNALSAHTDQFDFDACTWTIPASSAKAKRPIVIQCVDEVMEIAKRADGWLFPAKRSASGHRTNIAKNWKNLSEKAGVPQWKPHTLRKLFATTYGNLAGSDKGTAADLLGHVSVKSQKAYVNSTPARVRDEIERNVAELRRLAG